jgi:hypothetical protein
MPDALVPCGVLERLFFALGSFNEGAANGVSALQVRGLFDVNRLQAALQAVQQRHPKLRGQFTLDARGRLALQVPEASHPCPIEVIDRLFGTPDWDAELTRDVVWTTGQLGVPLWRVRVVQDRAAGMSDLVLISHHSLIDGGSGSVWFHDVLSIYANEDPGRDVESLPVRMSGRLAVPASFKVTLQMLGRVLRIAWRELTRPQRLPPPPPQSAPVWTHFSITGDAVKAFRANLARNETSLSALVVSAAALAMQEILGLESVRMICGIALDVRRLMAPPVSWNEIGCFNSLLFYPTELTTRDELNDLARRMRLKLMESLFRREPAWQLATMDRMPRRLLNRPKTTKRQPVVVGVSDFGVYQLKERYGDIVPERIRVNTHGHSNGPALGVVTVQIGQTLCFSVAYAGLSAEMGEACVQRLREILGPTFNASQTTAET